MAGPRIKSGGDPAIHVFAQNSTVLTERDARNKSVYDEKFAGLGRLHGLPEIV